MSRTRIAVWKNAPFLRLLIPLIAGIILQWYVDLRAGFLLTAFFTALLMMILYPVVSTAKKYRWRFILALSIQLLLVTAGMLLLYHNNITNSKQWFGALMKPRDKLVVRLTGDPVEKTNSFKCIAAAEYLLRDSGGVEQRIAVAGMLYLYLEKKSTTIDTAPVMSSAVSADAACDFHENDRLLLLKNPGPVKSSGNPYTFNYERYSLFQGITHQLYLREHDCHRLPSRTTGTTRAFFLKLQLAVLQTIRRYVHGAREAGLAEALLIGYKDDLDPELVTAYTNTGLAHVIAISGMHLALVYWILMMVLRPIGKKKGIAWLSPVLTIAGLWIFTILAGAQPSVLRSAVMFSCIVAGRAVSRNNSIYNSLFASAFILLCFNPFWLWDLGFQLSYAAVLSLLIFNKPVYHWALFSNRAIDLLWKSVSVSLSAQVLTIPISIFYFHQFPNYFIISNLVAVPVSTAVLFAEIILCAVALLPALATVTGQCISWMIRSLNSVIDYIAALPFATMEGLQIGLMQVILLYALIIAVWFWLAKPSPHFFGLAMFLVSGFLMLRSLSFVQCLKASYLVVYNVPKKTAIEWVAGRNAVYSGGLLTEKEYDFHLEPFHLKQRLPLHVPDPLATAKFIRHNGYNALTGHGKKPGTALILPDGKRVVLLSDRLGVLREMRGIRADLIVCDRKALAALPDILAGLHPSQVVLDSSIPEYLAVAPARACDSLGIRCHATALSGAFVLRLD